MGRNQAKPTEAESFGGVAFESKGHVIDIFSGDEPDRPGFVSVACPEGCWGKKDDKGEEIWKCTLPESELLGGCKEVIPAIREIADWDGLRNHVQFAKVAVNDAEWRRSRVIVSGRVADWQRKEEQLYTLVKAAIQRAWCEGSRIGDPQSEVVFCGLQPVVPAVVARRVPHDEAVRLAEGPNRYGWTARILHIEPVERWLRICASTPLPGIPFISKDQKHVQFGCYEPSR